MNIDFAAEAAKTLGDSELLASPATGKSSTAARLKRISSILFALALILPSLAAGDEGLRKLFDQAVLSQGKQYVQARDGLLKSDDVLDFLVKIQAAEQATSQRRWLADILIARKVHAEEMGSLEQTLYDKVTMPRPAALRRGSLEEKVPLLAGEVTAPLEVLRRRFKAEAEKVAEFHQAYRLPDSPLWRPLLGEVVLKGWTSPPASAARKDVTDDDFMIAAIGVLGKLRERRMRPTLELMVTDRNVATPTRRMAAIALGELGDTRSVVVLIVVVRDVDQDTHLRLDALYSLARIGDATAISGMRDVAQGDGAVAQRATDLIEQVKRGGVDRMYFE